MDRLEQELNPEQLEAVRYTDSPLLIFAGAGTGKTRVIAYKAAYLVTRTGLPPSSLLAVTFTNKSAGEMRERIRGLVGKKKSRPITVSTFHSLGAMILRKHIGRLGYSPRFLIYDEEEQLRACEKLCADLSVPEEMPPSLVRYIIQRIKGGRQSVEESPPLIRRVYTRYEQYLKNFNALDFDDLIRKPIELLSAHGDIRHAYHERFRCILIDEYQDTNPDQYELVRLLHGPGQAICAVGDDDQSIYSWRGSDIGIILGFRKDFRNARTIRLTRNYRSTARILEAANAVISHNARRVAKKLQSTRGKGDRLCLKLCADEEDEARFITGRIRRQHGEEGVPYSRFGILLRTNFQSRPFETSLRTAGIPYRLIGGRNFFDRKEVRDILAYLKVIANPRDALSLLRIINYPRRGIGDTTVAAANAMARETGTDLFGCLEQLSAAKDLKSRARKSLGLFVSLVRGFQARCLKPGAVLFPLVRELVEVTGYEKQLLDEKLEEEKIRRKMGNISELVNHVRSFQEQEPGSGLFAYLNRVSLISENDNEREKREGREEPVTILTVHASKGLEFERIFIPGMEKDLFPHKRTMEESGGDAEEERRLFYVALTRAKKSIILSRAASRKVFGTETEREPSPFLDEVPGELIRSLDDRSESDNKEERKKDIQKLLDRLK